jgi:hypothetical protein
MLCLVAEVVLQVLWFAYEYVHAYSSKLRFKYPYPLNRRDSNPNSYAISDGEWRQE